MVLATFLIALTTTLLAFEPVKCDALKATSLAWRAIEFSADNVEPLRVMITVEGQIPHDVAADDLQKILPAAQVTSLRNIPVHIAQFPDEISFNMLQSALTSFLELEYVVDIEHDSMVLLPGAGEFDGIVYDHSQHTIANGLVPQDPLFNTQWGLLDMKMPQAWMTATGVGLLSRVALIDTGVDHTHSDLGPNVWINIAEMNGLPGVDDDDNGYVDDIRGWNAIAMNGDAFDDHWHGTHCAGILAAASNNTKGIAGVNWGASIIPCKALSYEGTGLMSNALICIDYAIAVGANVLSNSWETKEHSAALLAAVHATQHAGQIFVAAAGNDGNDNDVQPDYPASYNVSNIIAVAALAADNALAPWSNYGASTTHIAAPGASIPSTIPHGSYAFASGTSMAVPHVAGFASLLQAVSTGWSPEKVKHVLEVTAAPIVDEGKLTSNGKLDAAKAMNYVDTPVSSTPAPLPPGGELPSTWQSTILSLSTETCSTSCQMTDAICNEDQTLLINSDVVKCKTAISNFGLPGNFILGESEPKRSMHPGGCHVVFEGSTYRVDINTNNANNGCDNTPAELAASFKVCICSGTEVVR